MIIWMTGLSGSGKTTYANYLYDMYDFFRIDGDELRKGINADLGYTEGDRLENIRRMIELAELACSQGYDVVVSTITPTEELRERVRGELQNRHQR